MNGCVFVQICLGLFNRLEHIEPSDNYNSWSRKVNTEDSKPSWCASCGLCLDGRRPTRLLVRLVKFALGSDNPVRVGIWFRSWSVLNYWGEWGTRMRMIRIRMCGRYLQWLDEYGKPLESLVSLESSLNVPVGLGLG